MTGSPDGMTPCSVCGKPTLFPPTCGDCEKKARAGSPPPVPVERDRAYREPRVTAARPAAPKPETVGADVAASLSTFRARRLPSGRERAMLLAFYALPTAEVVAGLGCFRAAYNRVNTVAPPNGDPFGAAERFTEAEPYELTGVILILAAIASFRSRGTAIVAQIILAFFLSFMIPAIRR